jgi:hypothetical protein
MSRDSYRKPFSYKQDIPYRVAFGRSLLYLSKNVNETTGLTRTIHIFLACNRTPTVKKDDLPGSLVHAPFCYLV